jgi:hypothetical protein
MQIPPRGPARDMLLMMMEHPVLSMLLTGHVMTKAERDAQRESWVVGEMMIEHPEMTRDEALRVYRKVVGE